MLMNLSRKGFFIPLMRSPGCETGRSKCFCCLLLGYRVVFLKPIP
jgi:hypothetical protein